MIGSSLIFSDSEEREGSMERHERDRRERPERMKRGEGEGREGRREGQEGKRMERGKEKDCQRRVIEHS